MSEVEADRASDPADHDPGSGEHGQHFRLPLPRLARVLYINFLPAIDESPRVATLPQGASRGRGL